MIGIPELVSLIRALRKDGKRFVLMLGAGASVGSGVPDTRTMMKGVVGSDPGFEERFAHLMDGPEENRRTLLREYLEKTPSSGYRSLAQLIKEGYFDTVITFNFDMLLEKALHDTGVHDFETIIRGEIDTDKIPAKVAESGVKILKLHGSLKGVSSFVFARVDLVAYPKEIATTVEDLTGGDILVCGYDYNDQCVISCFSKDGKGNVAIVNPKPPQMLLDVAAKRKGQFVFPSKFDDFFDHLAAALLHGGETPTPPPKRNPYKFLEAYRVEDRESFYGREEAIKEAQEKWLVQPPRACSLTGAPKTGKTSFVRAGIMPLMLPHPMYLRCPPRQWGELDLEAWLPVELAKRLGWSDPVELGITLKALAEGAESHAFLILDQFERVVVRYQKKQRGRQEFQAMMTSLIGQIPERLTVLFISNPIVDLRGDPFLLTLNKLNISQNCLDLLPLESNVVGGIMQRLAADAGITASAEAIEGVQKIYDPDSSEPFTLAHVNAVCHLLADSGDFSLANLERIIAGHKETLHEVIKQYDVMGFFEDIPLDEKARALMPRMMKVISPEGRKNLAQCLEAHFGELFPAMNYARSQGHGE